MSEEDDGGPAAASSDPDGARDGDPSREPGPDGWNRRRATDAAEDRDRPGDTPASDPPVDVPATATGRGPDGEGLLGSLRLAGREHLPYALFSTALFLVGVVGGVALVGRVDLFAALGVGDASGLFPETVTAVTILVNNTRAVALMVLGALTLGLLTALALVFNGVIVGYVAGGIAAERGLAFVVVGLAPHGILELPAIFVAAGVAFRVVHATALRVIGRREYVLGRAGWKRTGQLLVTAWVALLVAAVVEFYVTGTLLQALFG